MAKGVPRVELRCDEHIQLRLSAGLMLRAEAKSLGSHFLQHNEVICLAITSWSFLRL